MLTLLMIPDFTLHLPLWKAKKPTESINHDEASRQIVTRMITVQLLASCFTSPQIIDRVTIPSGRYRKQHQTNDNVVGPRLVSSLRQHSQWKHSPAHGHHARNNSAV